VESFPPPRSVVASFFLYSTLDGEDSAGGDPIHSSGSFFWCCYILDAFDNLRAGHDILVNPVLRHVYDRFGPTVLRCTHCITTKDYLDNGLSTIAVLYAITFFVLILMSVFRLASFGRYWRFILLVAMGGLELAMVLSPKPLQVMVWFMPYWVTFEQITLLHHLYLAVSIALYKVGPILTPWHADNNNNSSSGSGASSEKAKKETIRKQLKRLEELK